LRKAASPRGLVELLSAAEAYTEGLPAELETQVMLVDDGQEQSLHLHAHVAGLECSSRLTVLPR
jgi:hypothetical protein